MTAVTDEAPVQLLDGCPCPICIFDTVPWTAYRPHMLTPDCWCETARKRGTCAMTWQFQVRPPIEIGHP